MSYFSILHLFAAALYFFLGVYTIGIDSSSQRNRGFLALCINFTIWAFTFAFMHSAANMQDVWFWYKVSAVSWCSFSSIALHGILFIVGKERIYKNPLILILLYLPGLFFLILELTRGVAARGFVYAAFGWNEVLPADSPVLWLFFIYQGGYVFYALALLWLWGKRSRVNKEKKQARLIAGASAVAVFLCFVFDVILPMMKIYIIPAVAPLLMIIWAFSIWYSIKRYQFLSMDATVASEAIISKMKDILILLDPGGKIITVNRQLTVLLGYDEHDVVGRHLYSIIKEDGFVESRLTMIHEGIITRFEFDGNLISSDNFYIPFHISFSVIKDSFNDFVGIVGVASDLREKHKLLFEISEHEKTSHSLRAREEELKRRNSIMEKDLADALIIQQALLPGELPELNHLKADFRYQSLDTIGGDFFSLFRLDDGRVAVFIADVTGHGVSAALFLSLIKSESERIARDHGTEPDAFMDVLNKSLIQNMPRYFITAVYGIFDYAESSDTMDFTFCRGGHPAPALYRAGDNSVRLVSTRGAILGKLKNAQYTQNTITLEKGDRIFLYTDGFPETRNQEDAMIGFDKVTDLVRSTTSGDISITLDNIISRISDFRGARMQEDDIVIMGFEFI